MKNEIQNFLNDFSMNISTESQIYYLNIPNFSNILWRAPLRNRLRKNKPNIFFYEETTTSIIAFLLERYDIKIFFDVGASTKAYPKKKVF